MTTVLYTRRACPLCDTALTILQQHGLDPQLIDVDQDQRLRAMYGDCVPVVVIDNKVRFRGRINQVLLRRILHAS